MTRSQLCLLLHELRAYLREGTFVTGSVTGSAYPTLRAYDITVFADEAQSAYVNFDIGATSFAPLGAFPAAMHRAGKKTALAHDYRFPHPLWLVLGITDQLGVFTESVVAFSHCTCEEGRSTGSLFPMARSSESWSAPRDGQCMATLVRD